MPPGLPVCLLLPRFHLNLAKSDPVPWSLPKFLPVPLPNLYLCHALDSFLSAVYLAWICTSLLSGPLHHACLSVLQLLYLSVLVLHYPIPILHIPECSCTGLDLPVQPMTCLDHNSIVNSSLISWTNTWPVSGLSMEHSPLGPTAHALIHPNSMQQ